MTSDTDKHHYIDKQLPLHAIVVWLTGLSGSGKSTIAFALKEQLSKNGIFSLVLDGDIVRKGLNKDLGYSITDRHENIRRVAEISKMLIENRVITICAFVSPTHEIRRCAKEIIGHENFFEVYVKTSLDICEKRDAHGLYKKSRSGEIHDFTGVSSPFEVPESPDLIIDTNDVPVTENVERIFAAILPLLEIQP
ncbi:MAG: adenylyl-sulfate kinase [Bacteroidota bacterium]|nr:adenylyl-sulfate kinase [Bacteroidota bacterium]